MTPNIVQGVKVINLLTIQHSTGTSQIQISWDFNSESDIQNYLVYRNYVPYGNFSLVGTVASTSNTFIDSPSLETVPSSPGSMGLTNNQDGFWYYKLVAINTGSQTSVPTEALTYINYGAFETSPFSDISIDGKCLSVITPCSLLSIDDEDMEDFFIQIRARDLWLLDQDGEWCFLFKKMVEGTKCPYWQDDAQNCEHPKGHPDDNPINACYNTGIIGGYYSPIKIKVRLIASAKSISFKEEGMMQIQTPRNWTIWTPLLASGDFFLLQDGTRYELQECIQQRFRGLVTHQEFEVSKKFPTDLIFAVPVTGTLP